MAITNYICELLYRYDCVIVPEFGAFLSKRKVAHFSDDQQLIYAPQKQISFNQQINSNDGLLANYIASSEQISYEKALEKLENFSKKILLEIHQQNKLILSDIGFFTINFENNLVFEPFNTTNYLTEAFGLANVKLNCVERESLKEKEELNVIENVPPISIVAERSTKSIILKYASVAAVALIISSIGLKTYNNNEIIEAQKLVNNQFQNASFIMDIENPLPNITINTKKEVIVEEINEGNYHIVAGAFRDFTNVNKKINQLKSKGFTARYIGKNKYGLHQVVYNSFHSKNEAINVLNKIKATENKSAWLLIQK